MNEKITPPRVQYTQLIIDGELRDATGGSVLDDINPATGQLIVHVASAGIADVDAAVGAARRAFDEGPWSRMSGSERGQILLRLADLVERDADILAGLEALDVGKPVRDARIAEIENAIATLRYFAGWADKIEGRTIPTAGFMGRQALSYTVREPVGVVGAIVPWNGPTMISTWKIAPALAAGCTIVLKPSEDAPLPAIHLGQLAQEAGLPRGVLNVITGVGSVAGDALTRHPGVDKITFTGSTQVGRAIQIAAAETFKPVTLELGGKSPQIILGDADIAAATAGTAMGLFFNAGEVCAAGSRILVERGIRDEVVDGLVTAAKGIRVGDPFDPLTTMGALINSKQRDRVLSYIDIGQSEGAEIAAGGSSPNTSGYFVEPTIFTNANNSMRIAQEEIFGPVGAVIEFDNMEEAIELANASAYGLAANIWTSDVSAAHSVARRVRAGSVAINAWSPIGPQLPWGGIKSSGIGRELGKYAIHANTDEKVITVVM